MISIFQKQSEQPKLNSRDWALILGFVLAGGIYFHLNAGHVYNSVNAPDAVSVRPYESPSAVQGLSANWLMAKQSNKHDEVVKALTVIRNSQDPGQDKMADGIRLMSLHSVEVVQAIDEVSSGPYSLMDKQKMLKVLEMEKDWTDAAIIAFSN